MPSLSSLFKQLQTDYSDYAFVQGDTFTWVPSKNTIVFASITTQHDIWDFMHELGHARLKHSSYILDIDLVERETQAWNYAATQIAPRYDAVIDADYIQDCLDSYRRWLHDRSTCPKCGQNGVQTQNTYRCINCRCLWRANEARICALKRTII